MTKLLLPIGLALVTTLGCGDNGDKHPDATPTHDSGIADAMPDSMPIPPPPTLGAQIDRLGRPAISTALVHTFDLDAAAKGAAKDAYNQDGDASNWVQTYAPEFAKNLAIIDALDGTCGNQVLYSGPASATSYATLAGLLAGDELYLDTTLGSCQAYLAVEFEIVAGVAPTQCGGRAPSNDVIDTSYSALAAGLAGFDPTTLAPLVKDNVAAHGDVDDATFPFLGAPH
jgi:hypothetical protein